MSTLNFSYESFTMSNDQLDGLIKSAPTGPNIRAIRDDSAITITAVHKASREIVEVIKARRLGSDSWKVEAYPGIVNPRTC